MTIQWIHNQTLVIVINVIFHVAFRLMYVSMLSSDQHTVPLIIGGASSVTAEIQSRILGPLSVPLVSSGFVYTVL